MIWFKALWVKYQAWFMIAAVLASFAAGWTVHKWKTGYEDGKAVEKGIDISVTENKESDRIVGQRDEAEVKERIVYRTIKKRIENETSDNVCFSPNSLSLWNEAIAGADSHRTKPEASAATDGAAGASERDILRNAATNFEICNANSRDHNALIDKVESLEGKMCYCSN
jgi:hypothetical protein